MERSVIHGQNCTADAVDPYNAVFRRTYVMYRSRSNSKRYMFGLNIFFYYYHLYNKSYFKVVKYRKYINYNNKFYTYADCV